MLTFSVGTTRQTPPKNSCWFLHTFLENTVGSIDNGGGFSNFTQPTKTRNLIEDSPSSSFHLLPKNAGSILFTLFGHPKQLPKSPCFDPPQARGILEMGCACGKTSTYSPGTQTLEQLKFENGYVKGVNAEKLAAGKVFRHGVENKNVIVVNAGNAKAVAIEAETARINGGNGNVSQRTNVVKKIGVEELVDGWPKWLVDNVSKEILAGLVPKSADSYDKLSKVKFSSFYFPIHLEVDLLLPRKQGPKYIYPWRECQLSDLLEEN